MIVFPFPPLIQRVMKHVSLQVSLRFGYFTSKALRHLYAQSASSRCHRCMVRTHSVMHTSQTLRRRNSIKRQTHAHIHIHSNPSTQPPTNHLIQKLWHRHTRALKVEIRPCRGRFSIQLRSTGIYLLISVLAIRNTHLILAAIVASLSATQCC